MLRRGRALRDRPAVRSRRQHRAPPGDSCTWCGRIVSSAVGAGSFSPALAVLEQSQRAGLHVQRLGEQLLCPISIQMIVTLSFPLPRHCTVARWRSRGPSSKSSMDSGPRDKIYAEAVYRTEPQHVFLDPGIEHVSVASLTPLYCDVPRGLLTQPSSFWPERRRLAVSPGSYAE